jgi:hypothetical protein
MVLAAVGSRNGKAALLMKKVRLTGNGRSGGGTESTFAAGGRPRDLPAAVAAAGAAASRPGFAFGLDGCLGEPIGADARLTVNQLGGTHRVGGAGAAPLTRDWRRPAKGIHSGNAH